MKSDLQNTIRWVRTAYWAGILLDGFSFLQMAFPRVSARMMGSSLELGPEFVFAMRLGAALMLAWTVLLVWADRKPLERRDILWITLIIIVMNVATLVGAVRDGLLPWGAMLPQIVLCSILFLTDLEYVRVRFCAKRLVQRLALVAGRVSKTTLILSHETLWGTLRLPRV